MTRTSVSDPAWAGDPVLARRDPLITREGHCWLPAHRFSRYRYPCNDLTPVTVGELREVFSSRRAAAATYFELSGGTEANGSLYICRDRTYSIDKLSANNRSKVRRGLKRFTVGRVSADVVGRLGYPCYAGTHERNGLSYMDQESFRQRWSSHPGSQVEMMFAAIQGDQMGALLRVRRLGSWAEIVGASSATALLGDYPNHALLFTLLEQMLIQEGLESVSYGLSSVQAESRAESLHHFKLSIGFEAVPIRRCVAVHPIVRPLLGSWLRPVANFAQEMFPKSRRVRAAAGALKLIVGR